MMRFCQQRQQSYCGIDLHAKKWFVGVRDSVACRAARRFRRLINAIVHADENNSTKKAERQS